MSITKEELLRELSARHGGSILVDKKKMDLNDCSVLFISLGGMGAKTLNAIKQEVNERLNPSPNIKYLAIDTDTNELEGIMYPKGNIMRDECIGLFESFGAVHLKCPPENIRAWLDHELYETKLDAAGAKGVRQVGRAFLANPNTYNKVKLRILNILNSLLISNVGKPIYVYTVAGISGGTGSGTVIDIGYIIRECMESLPDAKSTAILYMADIQKDEPWAISGQWRKLYKNCYATLKEIDYFYNIEQRGGSFKTVVSGANSPGITKNIFDDVILVSKQTNANGVVNVFSNAADAIKSTARAITFLISDINLVDSNGLKVMTLQSSLINQKVKIDGELLNQASNLRLPGWGMYRYSTFSYSSVYIPRDELMAYCANILFEKITDKWKHLNRVNENSVEDVLKSVHMADLKSLLEGVYNVVVDERKFAPTVNGEVYPALPSLRVGAVRYVDDTFEWAKDGIKRAKRDAVSGMKNEDRINQFVSPVFEMLDKAFADPEKGPYYAIHLLSANSVNGNVVGILGRIDSLKAEITSLKKYFRDATSDIEAVIVKKQCELKGFAASSDEDIAAYISLIKKYGKSTIKEELLNHISDFIDAVYNRISAKNNNLYSIFTTLLETLPEILGSDSEYASDSKRTKVGTNETFTFDVINMDPNEPATARFVNFFESLVDNDDINARSTAFVNEVLVKLKQDFDVHGAEVNAKNVAERVRRYFGGFFGALSNDTIEKLCVLAYNDSVEGRQLTPGYLTEIWSNDVERESLLSKTATNIKQIMDAKALPYLATNDQMVAKISHFPRYEYIGLLSETKELNSKFNFGVASNIGVLQNGGNEIFHAQVVVGIPLFAVSMMEEGYNWYLNEAAGAAGINLDAAWLTEMQEPFGYLGMRQIRSDSYLSSIESKKTYSMYMSQKESIEKIYNDLKKLKEWGLLLTGEEVKNADIPQEASRIYGNSGDKVAIDYSPETYYLLGREISGAASDNEFEMRVNDVLRMSLDPKKETVNIFKILQDMQADFKKPKIFNRNMRGDNDTDIYKNSVYRDLISHGTDDALKELACLVSTCRRMKELCSQIMHTYAKFTGIVEKVRREVEESTKFDDRMNIFVEGIRYGVISNDTELKIWQYNKSDSRRPVNLFEYPHARSFDKEFMIYHAYSTIYNMSPEEIACVEKDIKALRMSGAVPADRSDIRKSAEKVLSNTTYLGNRYDRERVNNMSAGFRDSLKDDVKYDVPEISGMSIDKKIKNLEMFYETFVKKEFCNTIED